MEVELKYTIQEKGAMEALWQDPILTQAMVEGTSFEENFVGTYYDTADFLLLQQQAAYRIRREGRKRVACLKWGGQTQGALHSREELNVNLPELPGEEVSQPDLSVFAQNEKGAQLLELVGDAPLLPIIQVQVVRKAFRIDVQDSLMEVSLDEGRVITSQGETPIRELEVELFTGDQESLLALGAKLCERYPLVPEVQSKFSRGLALLGKK